MTSNGLGSWGNVFEPCTRSVALHWPDESLPTEALSLLPYGNGRSYGDSCLNHDGVLVETRGLDRFIEFDPVAGILRCEAGVLLSDIIDLVLPHGWFLRVTPGTRYVTVGGAIANDVHGKNHHRYGTFGLQVRSFELLRSDGSRIRCSPEENAEWFAATAGGLGLTGLITSAEIQLKRVAGPWIDVETIRYGDLDEFFAITAESDQDYEHTMAWVDCTARSGGLGRGIFMRGNHSDVPYESGTDGASSRSGLGVPVTPPWSLVNRVSLRCFNFAYYHRQIGKRKHARAHYHPFLYPLDGVMHWNRIYGRRGFLQYQCVVPEDVSRDALAEMLGRIARSGNGSFLGVLKLFGQVKSPGLLSFPRPGTTLALDFPNKGAATHRLLDGFDDIVREAGGAVYPAKDARMSAESFQTYFPEWTRLRDFVDPAFSSSFWRRVTESA